jgi:hypothetical protein
VNVSLPGPVIVTVILCESNADTLPRAALVIEIEALYPVKLEIKFPEISFNPAGDSVALLNPW